MGYYIVFTIMKMDLHEEMRSEIKNINNKEIQKLIFQVSEFKAKVKLTEDDEFIFNGEMFDIIRSEKNGDNIIVYCINDKKEEQLISFVKENYSSCNDRQNPLKERTLQIIKNIIKDALQCDSFKNNESTVQNTLCFMNNYSVIKTFIQIPSPPPKA